MGTEPKLIKINQIDFDNLKYGTKLLGFQKDYKAVDIRIKDHVFRPDFDMIDYYLIQF